MGGTATLIQQPRKWLSAKAKLQIVQESYESGLNVAEIARKYHVGVSSLIKWRKLAASGGLMSIKKEETVVPISEVKKLQQRIRELERIVGKKTIETEILKEAIEIAREKKLISQQPLPGVDDIVSDV